jgi:hypothetical protein
VLRLYQDCIRFRQAKLNDRRRGVWQVELVSDQTLALRYSPPENAEVLILVQLVPAKTTLDLNIPILRPSQGHSWKFSLSSNESEYGGEQPGFCDPKKEAIFLIQPETIMFVAHS